MTRKQRISLAGQFGLPNIITSSLNKFNAEHRTCFISFIKGNTSTTKHRIRWEGVIFVPEVRTFVLWFLDQALSLKFKSVHFGYLDYAF